MRTVAKVLAGIGAAILLASGACFLWVDSMLGGTDSLPWIVGVALIVAGVLVATALLSARRRDP